MSNYDDVPRTERPDTTEPGGRRRWWTAGAVVAAVLVGGGVGYLIGTAGGPATPAPGPPAAAAPPPAAPAAPTTTSLANPPPCLTAGEAGAAVLEQVELGVQAIGELDPTAMREVLDRLQPLQRDLEGAVADCYGRISPPPATPTG